MVAVKVCSSFCRSSNMKGSGENEKGKRLIIHRKARQQGGAAKKRGICKEPFVKVSIQSKEFTIFRTLTGILRY